MARSVCRSVPHLGFCRPRPSHGKPRCCPELPPHRFLPFALRNRPSGDKFSFLSSSVPLILLTPWPLTQRIETGSPQLVSVHVESFPYRAYLAMISCLSYTSRYFITFVLSCLSVCAASCSVTPVLLLGQSLQLSFVYHVSTGGCGLAGFAAIRCHRPAMESGACGI